LVRYGGAAKMQNINGLSSEEGERSGPVEAFNGVVADEAHVE
jgi:hypothetical protein